VGSEDEKVPKTKLKFNEVLKNIEESPLQKAGSIIKKMN
jgi:hypothetical protein